VQITTYLDFLSLTPTNRNWIEKGKRKEDNLVKRRNEKERNISLKKEKLLLILMKNNENCIELCCFN
jgi:hypothetical protein